MTPAERLVAAVQSRGSDATDPRDAAHEAAHALSWCVTKPWTRERIDRAKPFSPLRPSQRAFGVSEEVTARAVEWIVCERLGIEYDLAKWAGAMWWETMKLDGIALPTDGWCERAITHRKATNRPQELSDQVLALEVLTPRKRSAKRRG